MPSSVATRSAMSLVSSTMRIVFREPSDIGIAFRSTCCVRPGTLMQSQLEPYIQCWLFYKSIRRAMTISLNLKPRIAILEDHEDTREMLRVALESDFSIDAFDNV